MLPPLISAYIYFITSSEYFKKKKKQEAQDFSTLWNKQKILSSLSQQHIVPLPVVF